MRAGRPVCASALPAAVFAAGVAFGLRSVRDAAVEARDRVRRVFFFARRGVAFGAVFLAVPLFVGFAFGAVFLADAAFFFVAFLVFFFAIAMLQGYQRQDESRDARSAADAAERGGRGGRGVRGVRAPTASSGS